MTAIPFTLLARNNASAPVNHLMLDLLVVLLAFLILAVLLAGGIIYIRQRRRARRGTALPSDVEKRLSTSSTASSRSHHRRVMIRPSESALVYQEKQNLLDHSSAPPSPSAQLPEIRITFAEEYDASGKRVSGRVVVVTLSDASVGLAPVRDDLPAYEINGERFHSVDLDRVGGLVEKARNSPPRWGKESW